MMRRELIACQPDIVHAQWTYEFADAGLSSGFPCLVTARDAPWIVAWQFRAFYRLYRAIYESLWIAPRIAYMTSVSTHIDSVFQKELLLKPLKKWVVPNGIDEQFVVKEPKQCVANSQEPIFFDVSSWNGLKNPIPLLQAFRRIRTVLPMARLCVIGLPTGGRTAQERYAIRNNLLDGVELLDHMSNLALLRFLEERVDVVVHTTKEESFSMVALEGMAKGIPVIGGKRSGAVPFVLGEGNAGVLVDIQSPQEIADAMLRLVNDTAFYRKIAMRALVRVRECFLLDKVVAGYERIYREISKKNVH
jgi:glycosyltransferase involved in cell wall biosynthesis